LTNGYRPSKSLHLIPVTLHGCVPINTALSREAQFTHWIDALAPRNCKQHRRRQLVLDREASLRELLSGDNTDAWHRRWMKGESPSAETLNKSYAFEAIFRCPACKVQ
jgi:hypothetical protein